MLAGSTRYNLLISTIRTSVTRRSPRRSIGVEATETLLLGLQPRYITCIHLVRARARITYACTYCKSRIAYHASCSSCSMRQHRSVAAWKPENTSCHALPRLLLLACPAGYDQFQSPSPPRFRASATCPYPSAPHATRGFLLRCGVATRPVL